MDRREELERWIAGSRAVQNKLKIGLTIAGAITVALFFVSRVAGGISVAIVSFVAVAGFWITSGHISDWQDKLYKLDHPSKPNTSHRRYQAD